MKLTRQHPPDSPFIQWPEVKEYLTLWPIEYNHCGGLNVGAVIFLLSLVAMVKHVVLIYHMFASRLVSHYTITNHQCFIVSKRENIFNVLDITPSLMFAYLSMQFGQRPTVIISKT